MTILPQGPVVHVERPLPEDVPRVERGVAEVEPVVDRRGQQVVGGGDRVEVAGELEVDRVRRLEPARAAAGRPPLRPKTGPIDGCRSASADRLPILRSPCARPIEIVVFPSPAGRRRDRRDQDQLARRPVGPRRAPRGGPSPCRGRRAPGARRRSPGRGPPRRSVGVRRFGVGHRARVHRTVVTDSWSLGSKYWSK